MNDEGGVRPRSEIENRLGQLEFNFMNANFIMRPGILLQIQVLQWVLLKKSPDTIEGLKRQVVQRGSMTWIRRHFWSIFKILVAMYLGYLVRGVF